MIDSDPVVRVALMLGGFAVVTGVPLAGAWARIVSRWWSSSITVTVARARLSAWCTYLGRLLHHLLLVVLPRGGRVRPTAGAVSPTAGSAVCHQERAA